MKYRICFEKIHFDDGRTEHLTKEFSALNNQAALKIYEDFCRWARNSSSNFISAYPTKLFITYLTGLFKIIQREKTRRVK